MKWQVKIFTLIIGLSLLLLGFALPLISSWLYWFGIFFLSMVGLLLVGFIILSWQISREKLLDVRATRKQKEYITQLDGHGMLHLINVATGHTQNLTIDTRAYRNGHYEAPSTHELAAFSAVVSKGKELPQASQLLLDAPKPPTELLPLMKRARRVLIFGASEAGKTTLLQWIASESQGVVIVDPHYEPGKWPDVRIIGAGRNFSEVINFMTWLETELDSRAKRKAKGDSNFELMTIIIDELSTIKMHCGDEAIKPLASMIMESNKFGFRIFVGGHSKLVELLGLKGMSDIREGLFIVHLSLNQITGERVSTVDLGDGKVPCQYPPYYSQAQLSNGYNLPDLPKAGSLVIDKREAEWLELVQNGMSKNKASQQVYGRNFGGDLLRLNGLLNSTTTSE